MPPLFPTVTAESSWRHSEAALFQAMARMEDGWVPAVQSQLSQSDLRRLGYLAEMIARFGRAPDSQQLLAFASRVLADVSRLQAIDPIGESVVPGARIARYKQLDALAGKWGFHPGVDLDRYRSEMGR